MTCEQAIEWFHSRKRFSHRPGLEEMRRLMRRLGDPQDRLRFVHVAGTNGKGSVTAMTAAILTQAGYRTGMNISPYVTDFRERFQIDGEMISPEKLAQLTARVAQQAQEMQDAGEGEIGEFEAVTAVAFLWFAEEACDIVCLEVGLGGRYDATNIIAAPLVTCIVRIGLDHTAVLGNTVEQIAAEKCGIIKPETTVIVTPQQPQAAMRVIREICEKQNVQMIVPEEEDITWIESNLLQNRIDYGGYTVELPMKGRWQAYHAAMAVETALELCRRGFEIDDDSILAGLAQAKQPARMEIVSMDPLILLDGCHNPDGVDAMASMIERSGLPKMHAVIGMMKDKACEAMLRRLSDCFDLVVTAAPDNPRSMPTEELAALARPYFDRVESAASVQQAIARALQGVSCTRGLCVCGSLYLASEAEKILHSRQD